MNDDILETARRACDCEGCREPERYTRPQYCRRDAIAAALTAAVRAERERRHVEKPIDDPSLCTGCGGPHPFDTTIPSVTWNRVIRAAGLPEFLCTTCIVRAFAKVGEGFTAQLWSDEFYGVPVEFSVNGVTANSHAEMSEENTRLRAALRSLVDAVARHVARGHDQFDELDPVRHAASAVLARTCRP